MSSQFDDFDLDIRFYVDPTAQDQPAIQFADTSPAVCQVVQTVLGCQPPPVQTLGLDCEIVIQPTVLAAHTCEQTCAPQRTCPANTCGPDCITDTCPADTCGCNTSETCNHVLCDGGGITAPPKCQDVSGGEDTCDACPPQTGSGCEVETGPPC